MGWITTEEFYGYLHQPGELSSEREAEMYQKRDAANDCIRRLNAAKQFVKFDNVYVPFSIEELDEVCHPSNVQDPIWDEKRWTYKNNRVKRMKEADEYYVSLPEDISIICFSSREIADYLPEVRVSEQIIQHGTMLQRGIYRFSDDPDTEPWLPYQDFTNRVISRFGEGKSSWGVIF